MKIAPHLRWSITQDPLPDAILDVLADLHWGRDSGPAGLPCADHAQPTSVAGDRAALFGKEES